MQSVEKLLELISEFSKDVGYHDHVNMHKALVFLYASKEQSN